jgi:carbon monoxide dehydrogenase subunit G
MKVVESFVVSEPRDRLWAFFEQVEQVARCVPGVDSVEQLDEETSKVRLTQAVGPMRATFDMKMRITEREPQQLLRFTATGKAVKGAAGNVRTVNTVQLQPVDGGTRVDLESDVALGGVLGSVGQKVVARQAAQVTRAFSESLERALKGEPVGVAPPTATATAPTPTRAAPVAVPGAAPATAPAGDGAGPGLAPGFRFGFGLGLGLGAGAGIGGLVALALRRLVRL